MPNMDQALTDEDIVSGHPGNTPEEGEYQEGDSQVTVKIDGKEYLLSADQAEAFNAREREYKRKLSEQGAELGRLRRQTSQPIVQQPVQQPVDEDEDVDVALFKDPKGYLKKFEDRIINKVTTTYQRKIAMDTFWSDFYDANPDLKKAKVLAE
ncbi:MAG: hypothetical protein KGI05_09740, partial [Thaumarchaeota archaeon]|nr:hypothetical protein [Nitrososphaerota archaeon]